MCALQLDVSHVNAMASTTVSPLAFAARVAGTRLDSRRRSVVRVRVPAKSRLVTESALKVDDSLNEDAAEGSKSPVVLAAAAVATAIVLAASPARGAEARPTVDVGAHDYYLETMKAHGLRPASIVEIKRAPAVGLNRLGSAATTADETASLVSTAFAVGLAAALGLSGSDKKAPGASGGERGWKKRSDAATAKSNIVKARAFGKNEKPGVRAARSGTAYVPSYRGSITPRRRDGSRGNAKSGSDSGSTGSGSAPAMQAAAALGATVVLGGLAGAGPAALEAEGAAVAAAATSAVLLGTAASAATQNKKKTDVRSNIITFKTAVAPAAKTRTKVVAATAPLARKNAAPPAKPPGGGANKTKAKPWRSPGDAPLSGASGSPAAVLAVVGLGALLLAGSATTANGPSQKGRAAKPSARKAPPREAPAAELPDIPAMDFNRGIFEKMRAPEIKVALPALDLEPPAGLAEVTRENTITPMVGATLLLSAAATLAGVGLEKRGSRRAYDPVATAKAVAEAQVWVNAWQRSILYPENPEHVFDEAWDRNAPTLEKAAEASTYAAEAAQARRPRPFSRADVDRRTGDAQVWIDAWAHKLSTEAAAKTERRSDEALRDWETGRIIGAWNKGLAESETRSAVSARVKQAQTWINAWRKTLKAPSARLAEKPEKVLKKKTTAKKTTAKKTTAKKTTAMTTAKKTKRRAYYETVAGVKYDKAVLEACRSFVARDGAVDLASAKTTWMLITDGATRKQTRSDGRVVKSSVTNVELATAMYALETFAWADDAAAWFRERVEGVDEK